MSDEELVLRKNDHFSGNRGLNFLVIVLEYSCDTVRLFLYKLFISLYM
jgi:hypothetical protein